MSNPYASPAPSSPSVSAQKQVNGPAIALMVIALVAIGVGVLGLALDAFLVFSGTVARMEAMNEGPVAESTMITVRTIWGIVLLAASCFVLYGALKMKSLTSYGTARAAAVVAMIPLVGPCCVLGIPFGIWAFIVLGKPHVKNAFS